MSNEIISGAYGRTFTVDTSIEKQSDYMGRAIAAIIGYVTAEMLKIPGKIKWIYSKGTHYPLNVIAEIPKEGGLTEEVVLASAMPGILGDTRIRLELNEPQIRRLGMDPKQLEAIVDPEIMFRNS